MLSPGGRTPNMRDCLSLAWGTANNCCRRQYILATVSVGCDDVVLVLWCYCGAAVVLILPRYPCYYCNINIHPLILLWRLRTATATAVTFIYYYSSIQYWCCCAFDIFIPVIVCTAVVLLWCSWNHREHTYRHIYFQLSRTHFETRFFERHIFERQDTTTVRQLMLVRLLPLSLLGECWWDSYRYRY